MADVDLIPAEYRRLQLVRRRVKQLLAACLSVAAVVGAARLALAPAASFERQSIARLETEAQFTTRGAAEAGRYRQQKALVEKQLVDLDELRGGDRLALLLQAIDAAYSASVWFDELRLVRRDATTAAAGGNSAAPSPAPAGARGGQRFEIAGHATSHTQLAEFMRRLGDQPGIADVRLQEAGLGSYRDNPVVDATLLVVVGDKGGKPR